MSWYPLRSRRGAEAGPGLRGPVGTPGGSGEGARGTPGVPGSRKSGGRVSWGGEGGKWEGGRTRKGGTGSTGGEGCCTARDYASASESATTASCWAGWGDREGGVERVLGGRGQLRERARREEDDERGQKPGLLRQQEQPCRHHRPFQSLPPRSWASSDLSRREPWPRRLLLENELGSNQTRTKGWECLPSVVCG